MQNLTIGSVVQLKTDGPKMTVKAYGTKQEMVSWISKTVDDTDR